jgi:hypothetical protein
MSTPEPLQTDLNSFEPTLRQQAVVTLREGLATGTYPAPPPRDIANMHCHTFFSFNAYGHSPSSLVWLAKQEAFKLIGMVDFDVLDGVDEFLNTCDVLQVRGSAGMETRVFVPEFATREINSPGEPGVLYHMGIGFSSSHVPESAQPLLQNLRSRARHRNLELIQRVNAHLAPVMIDYESDVLPLTPAANPTERHIVQAYIHAAQRTQPDAALFWADKLGMTTEQTRSLLDSPANLANTIRSKLMKKGGPGYITPDANTFPGIEPFHELITACGALPCAAWLDGTTPGEEAIEELLALLMSKGVVTFNIVPDRNWNISDPAQKQRKLQNLYDVVALTQALDLPLNVGTEMNSYGQKIVDDFDAAELAPVRQAFLDGAHFIYGHTVLQRQAGMGYLSEWARATLPGRKERNQFYAQVGYHHLPGAQVTWHTEMTPTQVLQQL